MNKATWLLAAVLAIGLAGCHDNTTAPRAVPPAAPRGLYSITGDQSVTLSWLANTEPGITGYRVYQDTSASPDGPYYRVGTAAGTTYLVTGLPNGHTLFFAVSAVGPGGESDLSYETIYDTPRPAGIGAAMVSYVGNRAGGTGWDFSAMLARPWTSPLVDITYRDSLEGSLHFAQVCVPDTAVTKIQDMGYVSTLDVIGYAPSTGWSPSGKAEAIEGHCYVVRTRDNNFAKFRVTGVTPGSGASPGSVVFDWAYQTDPGNGELRARRAGQGPANARQILVTRK